MQGKPLLIHRIATALGMENTKTSPKPGTINEEAQKVDEESLTPSEARNFKAMYLSYCRPDIQHSVNIFQINEASDDSNAKAQEAYTFVVWHE